MAVNENPSSQDKQRSKQVFPRLCVVLKVQSHIPVLRQCVCVFNMRDVLVGQAEAEDLSGLSSLSEPLALHDQLFRE